MFSSRLLSVLLLGVLGSALFPATHAEATNCQRLQRQIQNSQKRLNSCNARVAQIDRRIPMTRERQRIEVRFTRRQNALDNRTQRVADQINDAYEACQTGERPTACRKVDELTTIYNRLIEQHGRIETRKQVALGRITRREQRLQNQRGRIAANCVRIQQRLTSLRTRGLGCGIL